MDMPEWLEFVPLAERTPPTLGEIRGAIGAEAPGFRELAALLSPQALPLLEEMACRARTLTRRHFGRTISLYVPLYLSNYCSGGCSYCGFASDRDVPRSRLSREELITELASLKSMGFEEILLLTGERTPQADFDYLCEAVGLAAERFHQVTIETFPMTTAEYAQLAQAGCTGLTLYQETYDLEAYGQSHRWGPKCDYHRRLESPSRALSAGLRTLGIGALLGLADPRDEILCLYLHARRLQQEFWRAGISISFPRIRPQTGDFLPQYPIDERQLAQSIWALRIVLPTTPLVLSTRESAGFRNGMAGVGINKMSAASRTTVGGYADTKVHAKGQFEIDDTRSVTALCADLRSNSLQPVFKNWDAAYRDPGCPNSCERAAAAR